MTRDQIIQNLLYHQDFTRLRDDEILSLFFSKHRGFLSSHQDDIQLISLIELIEEGGFSQLEALKIKALYELVRRLATQQQRKKLSKVSSAEGIYEFMSLDMEHLDHEEMHVLLLNAKSDIISKIKLYSGTVDSSSVRIAEIYRLALLRNMPRVVVVHNHPSGDPEPSPEDLAITQEMIGAGKILGIELLDHIIIGNRRYSSIRERYSQWKW